MIEIMCLRFCGWNLSNGRPEEYEAKPIPKDIDDEEKSVDKDCFLTQFVFSKAMIGLRNQIQQEDY